MMRSNKKETIQTYSYFMVQMQVPNCLKNGNGVYQATEMVCGEDT